MLTSTTRAFGSPSRYIQGYGELERLQDYTADYGKKVLAIIDPFFYDTLSPSLKEAFEAAGSAIESVKFGGETTITELERLAAIASQNGSDVIVGIGGGKNHRRGQIHRHRGIGSHCHCPDLCRHRRTDLCALGHLHRGRRPR